MIWRVSLLAVCVGAFSLTMSLRPEMPPRYRLVDLGTFPGGSEYSQAHALNASGQVVGVARTAGGEDHACLWRDGKVVDLGTLGGKSSYAESIDDSGWIVGAAQDERGFSKPFLYRNGKMQALPTQGDPGQGWAYGINEAGQVVGNMSVEIRPSEGSWHAVLWQNGTYKDLGTLAGDSVSEARAVGPRGEVVGSSGDGRDSHQRAFLSPKGKLVSLGTLGGRWSKGFAISPRGEVVGQAALEGDTASHAFLYAHGQMRDLGTLEGFTGSFAAAINGQGKIVGYCFKDRGGMSPFLVSHGKMHALNTLVGVSFGGTVTNATGINENGLIAGTASFRSTSHACLLIPMGMSDR